jgi:uncharacterized membrane protein YczE
MQLDIDMSPALTLTRRIVQLLVGLSLYGIGISLMVQAGIGVAPWDVLTQGLSHQTGLDFGLLTNIIGGVVLLCWIPIRQRPGFGTLANVLLIGPSAQLGLWILPNQTVLVYQLLFLVGGILLIALATGLYIGARMGPGPRDGLMTGIHARTGWKLWIIRTAIEVTVLLIGWALGGNFGPGTIAFALLIGPLVSVTIPWLRVPLPRVAPTAVPADEVTSS